MPGTKDGLPNKVIGSLKYESYLRTALPETLEQQLNLNSRDWWIIRRMIIDFSR